MFADIAVNVMVLFQLKKNLKPSMPKFLSIPVVQRAAFTRDYKLVAFVTVKRYFLKYYTDPLQYFVGHIFS